VQLSSDPVTDCKNQLERESILKQNSLFRSPKVIYALIAGFLSYSALAQSRPQKITVHFDPAATEIRWRLNGNTHTVEGTFNLKGGAVSFDPATGVADGELVVDLVTGESGNKDRDAKMQKDVLESNKYPYATLHPSRISGTLKPGGTQTITADGVFNIHGADHPLQLQVSLKLEGSQATATTHFIVPYVAWGMKDPSVLLLRVGKEIDINIVAHGSVEQK